MTSDADERTEGLIRSLVRDLTPVALLPRLRRMTARVLLVVTFLLAGTFGFEIIVGLDLVKSNLGVSDWLGIAGHLGLAGGALALALASCVPGREAVERLGWAGVAVGAALNAVALVFVFNTSEIGDFGIVWLRGTIGCLFTAAIPALVPAALLAQFAARGAPHRPIRTLAYGSLAALGFATLPGHLSCPSGDLMHNVLAHHLAPITGGLLVLAATVASFVRPDRE